MTVSVQIEVELQLPLPVSLDHFLPSCDDALVATGEASVERSWGSQPAASTNLKWLLLPQLKLHEIEVSHPHLVLPNRRFKSKMITRTHLKPLLKVFKHLNLKEQWKK